MSSDENGWYLARHTQKSFDKLPIESAGADPAVAIPGTGRNATNANARETQRLSIEDLFHPNTRKEFPLEYRHRRRTGGPTAVLGNSKLDFIHLERGKSGGGRGTARLKVLPYRPCHAVAVFQFRLAD